MKVEYINPFIESLSSYWSGKLGCEVDRGDLGVSKGEVNVREFAAFTGFSGAVQGIIVLHVPIKTALAIASKLERKEVKVVDETVSDHLKLVIKDIASAAKEKFPAGDDIKMSGVAVLRSNEFAEKYSGGVWLEMPCDSELGDLKLRVALAGG